MRYTEVGRTKLWNLRNGGRDLIFYFVVSMMETHGKVWNRGVT